MSFLSSSSTETIYGSQTIEAKDLSPGESYNVQVSQFCGNHVNKSVFSEQKITMGEYITWNITLWNICMGLF